jgi:hypothetical protein
MHYGNSAYGNPLTYNGAAQTANNNAACPPPGPQPADTSCDEYPFATTNQGAAFAGPGNWGSVWAPTTLQSAQGGYLSQFYQQNRILAGDAFWVSLVEASL